MAKRKLTIWEKQLRKNVAAYQLKVDAIFAKYTEELVHVAAAIPGYDPNKLFKFADYPMTKARVDDLLGQMSSDLSTTIANGVDSAWTLADAKNDDMVYRALGGMLDKLPPDKYEHYFRRHDEALKAYKARRAAGMNLSDRVWKYTDQFQREIEMGVGLGIRDGVDAATMTKNVKQYLQYPDKLFRRVRNEFGQLVLSKAAKAFHPGAGVYRSSFKNARRLTATETNIAYRTSDFTRWNDLDFVVGIKVQKSHTNPGPPDMCDQLAGNYPKDFKFVGWHPLCRCFATSILKTPDELVRDVNDGVNRPSVNAVRELPDNMTAYVHDNAGRIARTKNLPYFLRDNGHRAEDGSFVFKEFGKGLSTKPAAPAIPSGLEVAAQRHANRTPEQIRAIKDAWSDRKDTIAEGKRISGLLSGIAEAMPYVDKLERSLSRANWTAAKTNIGPLRDMEARLIALKRIDDPFAAARKFSIAEIESTNAAVERTLSTWGIRDLDTLKGKLEFEISWVERNKRYPTWEVARDAYKKRLAEVEKDIAERKRKEFVANAASVFKVSRPTEKIKSLKAAFDLLTATPNWDMATAEGLLNKAKKAVAELEASRAKKAAKKVAKGGVSSVTGETLAELKERMGAATPKTLENLGDLIDVRRAEMIKRHGQEVVEKAEAFLQQVMDNGDFGMNIPRVSGRGRGTDDVIDNIFSSWFKCQQETGTGNGMVNVGARKRASRDLFGTDIATTKNHEYEKYGFLMDKDIMKQAKSGIAGQYWNYGDGIQVRFNRDKVLATITTTDSLSSGLYPCLTSEAKVSAIKRYNITDFANAAGKYDPTDIVGVTRHLSGCYLELQYHGALTLDCIESVYIPERVVPQLRKTALEKIKAVGCKVYTDVGGVAVPIDWDAVLPKP